MVRTTPTTVPSSSAMAQAHIAVASVQPRPVTSVNKNVPEPSGLSAQKMPQFHL